MVNPGRYFSEPGIHRDMTRTGASEVGVDSIYFDNIITADKLTEIELVPPPVGGADGGGASTDGAAPVDAQANDAAPMPSGTGGGSGGGSPATDGGGAGGAISVGSGGRGGATGISAGGAGCSTTPGYSAGPVAVGFFALLALWTRRRRR